MFNASFHIIDFLFATPERCLHALLTLRPKKSDPAVVNEVVVCAGFKLMFVVEDC